MDQFTQNISMSTNPLPTLSWQEEMRTAIKDHKQLEAFFARSFPKTNYSLFIPLSFASKIKASGNDSALARQFLPCEEENFSLGLIDPIADQKFSPMKGLVHRYPNRVLFFPTEVCPVHCRYCFRKNELNQGSELFKPNLAAIKEYLEKNEKIEEVIFSGGDPLVLSDQKLLEYFLFFSTIKNIRYIRIHTRMPIILPSRITEELIEALDKASDLFKKVHFVIHCNHPGELDNEVTRTIKRLNSQKFHLLGQSVLLAGVNDNSETLAHLFSKMTQNNIRPYYLHHPDNAKGTTHFQLDLIKGRQIFQKLRNQLPGWAIPQYMIEQPDGAGKIWAI